MGRTKKKAYIYLEDGTLLEGLSYGQAGTISGEICFSTSMTGYQETFTDPSYAGQILIMNMVHIGNYGTVNGEDESQKVYLKGIISRNLESKYSRSISNQSLEEYFTKHNVIAISGIDTRGLVKKVRDKGAMKVVLSTDNDAEKLKNMIVETPNMEGQELASKVSTPKSYFIGDKDSKHKIAVLDFGLKKSILRHLTTRGAYLKVFPANATIEEILDFNPDGVMLTNGPGDPSAMDYCVATIQSIITNNIPTFGICLGHQLLCKSMGLSTYKLLFGHRGANHPVKNLEKNNCQITTQNHGFGVQKEEIDASDKLMITHINLNDNTVEGVKVREKPAFSVQFHPEASPGPHDSTYLFDDFFKLIEEQKKN